LKIFLNFPEYFMRAMAGIKFYREEIMPIKFTEKGKRKVEDLPVRNQRYMTEINANLTAWAEGFNALARAAKNAMDIMMKHLFLNRETVEANLELIAVFEKLAHIHLKSQSNFAKGFTTGEQLLLDLEGIKEEGRMLQKWLDINSIGYRETEKIGKLLFEEVDEPEQPDQNEKPENPENPEEPERP